MSCSGPAPHGRRRTAPGPLDDLGIIEVLAAMYVETCMKVSCVPVTSLDADAFLPFAPGRSDYWPALVTARLPEPLAAR